MKILYSISGEGLGHAVRSGIVIDHLKNKHAITALSYDEGYEFLQGKVKDLHEISGLQLVIKKNKVKSILTIIDGCRRLPKIIQTAKNMVCIINKIKPDVIITDFEPISAYIGWLHHIPVIALDNIQIATKTSAKAPTSGSRFLNKLAIRLFTPFAEHYILPNFFPVKTNVKNVHVVPPVIRNKLPKVSEGDYIVAYQKPENVPHLLELFKQFPKEKFIVFGYGMERDIENVSFRSINDKTFMKALAGSKAVVARAGFTLISESLALGKPMMVIPIKSQYEQNMNGHYIKELGYGTYARNLEFGGLKTFIDHIPEYKKNLKRYKSQGNKELFSVLDEILREIK